MNKFSIGARLWLAIGISALVMLAMFASVAVRSARLTAESQAADERQARVTLVAARWSGLTETNVQRVIATTMGSDAQVAQHFAPAVKATSATISELQKELEALAASDEEKAQLAKVAAARKAYLDAREATTALHAKGDADAARQQLNGAVLPAVKAYLGEQQAFVELQVQLADRRRQAQAEARAQSLVFAGLTLALMLTGMAIGGLLLVRSIVRPLRAAAEVSRRIGHGDLTVHVDTSRRDEVGELMTAVAGMRDSLRHLVGQVRQASDSIRDASGEVAQGNADLSQRTETAAASLQQTASAMEELTGTVRQTADSARTASQLAASASSVAARGGQVVSQVVSTMDEINGSSRKIADITGVIDGIAFQTNILALNAAVEAARAGEQGRGFAVVAGEVRSLAQRSAAAAREIKSLIGTSVERVESGARLVGEAGTTMAEIVGSVQRVTDIIGEISAATQEQSTGIDSVGTAVTHLDQATQQNAALVEESAAAAGSLREQARQLVDLVAGFQLGDATTPRQVAARAVAAARHAVEPPRRPASAPVDANRQPAKAAGVRAATAAPAAPEGERPAARPAAPTPSARPADTPTAAADSSWETF